MARPLQVGVLLFFTMLIAAGCGTKTRVILLPEADGTVGKAMVEAGNKTVLLDQAYESAESTHSDRPVKNTGIMSREDVRKMFARALLAQPSPPEQFILYYEFGTSHLIPASRAMIPKILESIRERSLVQIFVSGHADRVGSDRVNKEIAAARAEQMRRILVLNGVPENRIAIESYGESKPLVPTRDGVPEPRNRCAEVLIR